MAAAAAALTTTVQTAEAVNAISQTVAISIQDQLIMNNQLRGGIVVLNQRIDLVQEEIDILWETGLVGCEWKYPGLCVTTIPYDNFSIAAN